MPAVFHRATRSLSAPNISVASVTKAGSIGEDYTLFKPKNNVMVVAFHTWCDIFMLPLFRYAYHLSYQITFTDRNNASVPLIHSGPLGPRCPFMNTLRCLGYVILHDRSLKAAFLSSIYAKGLDLSRNLTTAFRHWMNQEVDGPITNLLRLALFIADLRGLP